MKRLLIITLAAGVIAFALQIEIFARGGGGRGGGGGGGGGGRPSGGGGGGAARSGGGFSPSAPAARPSGPSASARPASTGGARPAAPSATARPSPGAPQAAARPAGGAPGAQPGARPATGAAGAQAGARPAGGAGQASAGQRPGSGAGAAAGARPSAGQLNNFLDVPGPAKGAAGVAGAAGAAGAARGGGAAADFLQSGTPARAGTAAAAGALGGAAAAGAVANRTARDAGRPGTPGDNLAQNRPERIDNRGERQGERDQRRDEVRNQYEQNNPGNFWEENLGWTAWAVTRPLAWASWGSVGSWCGYGGEAAPYSYGENIYYADDQVYYGDQPVATTEEYAQQAETIADTAPAQTPGKDDWLPLGVFAITQDGEASGAEPSLYMQLAISKQGVIAGTLKNTLTGKVQALEGMADKQSQRVAWSVVDQQRPIVETGLSNLTQDTSPALIHFADGQTQQWLMVRMPEPKS